MCRQPILLWFDILWKCDLCFNLYVCVALFSAAALLLFCIPSLASPSPPPFFFLVPSFAGMLPLALHFGYKACEQFLAGAHDMDVHFFEAPARCTRHREKEIERDREGGKMEKDTEKEQKDT